MDLTLGSEVRVNAIQFITETNYSTITHYKQLITYIRENKLERERYRIIVFL